MIYSGFCIPSIIRLHDCNFVKDATRPLFSFWSIFGCISVDYEKRFRNDWSIFSTFYNNCFSSLTHHCYLLNAISNIFPWILSHVVLESHTSSVIAEFAYRITLMILNNAFMIMSCLNNSEICLTISARLWRHRRWRQIGTLPTRQVGQRQRQQEIRWVGNVALLLL